MINTYANYIRRTKKCSFINSRFDDKLFNRYSHKQFVLIQSEANQLIDYLGLIFFKLFQSSYSCMSFFGNLTIVVFSHGVIKFSTLKLYLELQLFKFSSYASKRFRLIIQDIPKLRSVFKQRILCIKTGQNFYINIYRYEDDEERTHINGIK